MTDEQRSRRMLALVEAVELLHAARQKAASGPMEPWRMLNHAIEYLDKQLTELMRQGGENA